MSELLHPITFSIPEFKIVDQIPNKTKFISSLIPGHLHTYIYNTEHEYYEEYKKSLFAMTIKKAGWDCMRHYEILACGTIPYFPNIEECPPNTMALLPKHLIKEGNSLFEKYKNKTDINVNEINECIDLINRLLTYTRNHLTTSKMAQYVLDKSNCTSAKKILYLSGDSNTTPDYLRCLTLHGFKMLLGTNCHDYPKIPHIYFMKERLPYLINNFGKGYSYTDLMDNSLHDDSLDSTVEQDIINKKYDIVIYGSFHRGTPFYDLVQQYYSPEKVIFLCGEDLHKCHYHNYTDKGHHTFVREL